MAFAISSILGADLANPIPSTVAQPPFRPGTQAWGDDGKRYVFAKASGAISASTTACTVNASTFAASATGGSYTSPATAMATGDYAWFGAASV